MQEGFESNAEDNNEKQSKLKNILDNYIKLIIRRTQARIKEEYWSDGFASHLLEKSKLQKIVSKTLGNGWKKLVNDLCN